MSAENLFVEPDLSFKNISNVLEVQEAQRLQLQSLPVGGTHTIYFFIDAQLEAKPLLCYIYKKHNTINGHSYLVSFGTHRPLHTW